MPEQNDWRLAVTGYPGYGCISLETRALGPKLTASEDFAFVLFDAELQIPLRPWWTLKPYVEAGFGKFAVGMGPDRGAARGGARRPGGWREGHGGRRDAREERHARSNRSR